MRTYIYFVRNMCNWTSMSRLRFIEWPRLMKSEIRLECKPWVQNATPKLRFVQDMEENSALPPWTIPLIWHYQLFVLKDLQQLCLICCHLQLSLFPHGNMQKCRYISLHIRILFYIWWIALKLILLSTDKWCQCNKTNWVPRKQYIHTSLLFLSGSSLQLHISIISQNVKRLSWDQDCKYSSMKHEKNPLYCCCVMCENVGSFDLYDSVSAFLWGIIFSLPLAVWTRRVI